MTRSKETSDEILQDVFLKLWVKRATLTGVRSLDDYLFFMVRNRLFDERRRTDRQRKFMGAVHSEEPYANEPQEALLLKEYHALVQKAISQMPERRQKIFRMNAVEELSAREIAERLNMSLPAVKKQLYEAQHYLREYLKEHGDVLIALMLPALWQMTSAANNLS